jgi:hypothetical protein
MKVGKGSEIIEKNKSRRGVKKSRERRHVEYLVVGCKVIVAFIIIIGSYSEEKTCNPGQSYTSRERY